MSTDTRTIRFPAVAAAGLFLAAFGLYLFCFQPDGGWGDGADFVLCAHYLGVPHPTGYPLLALLGKLAALAPVGALGFRVGLLSSFAGAVAAALCLVLVTRLARNVLVGVLAAAVFALSAFVWGQSVFVEAYALNMAFFTAVCLAAASCDKTRAAAAFFFIAALGLGNHGTLVIPALFIGVVCLVQLARGVRVVPALGLVGFLILLGLFTYAALPLFSARSALFDWNHPQLARNLTSLIGGGDFWKLGGYIAMDRWRAAWELARAVWRQGGVVVLLCATLALFTRTTHTKFKWALAAALAANAVFAVAYSTHEKISFFSLSFAALVLLCALGLGVLLDFIKARGGGRFGAALLCAALAIQCVALLVRNNALPAERSNISAGVYAHVLFSSARRDALILVDHVDNDAIMPPLYHQFAHGARRDAFVFHRMFLAFPWWMDAMRARAHETASATHIPEVEASAQGGVDIRAIDAQTAELLESNQHTVAAYINTPHRFAASAFSRDRRFDPHGALFRVAAGRDAAEFRPLPDMPQFRDPVYRAMMWTLHVQRGMYYTGAAAAAEQPRVYRDALTAVVVEMETALKYKKDCDLHTILGDAYARLGKPDMAEQHARLAAECRRHDIDFY